MRRASLLLVCLLLTACGSPTPEPVNMKCSAADHAVQVCPAGGESVCGWYGVKIQCFAYPCAQNFVNSCEACKNENVDSLTLGSCPKAA